MVDDGRDAALRQESREDCLFRFSPAAAVFGYSAAYPMRGRQEVACPLCFPPCRMHHKSMSCITADTARIPGTRRVGARAGKPRAGEMRAVERAMGALDMRTVRRRSCAGSYKNGVVCGQGDPTPFLLAALTDWRCCAEGRPSCGRRGPSGAVAGADRCAWLCRSFDWRTFARHFQGPSY